MAGNRYGNCSRCGHALRPVFFTQEEELYNKSLGMYMKTGRKRQAVDVLVCPECLAEECVDDSFDGEWYGERNLCFW